MQVQKSYSYANYYYVSRGFSLIELMVVVAIIAVLATFALPAYRDYAIKAKVVEGIQLAQNAKFAIVEAYLSDNLLPANNQEARYSGLQKPTANVKDINIKDNGVISIEYQKSVGEGILTIHPIVINDGDISWKCGGEGTTIPLKHLPRNCHPN